MLSGDDRVVSWKSKNSHQYLFQYTKLRCHYLLDAKEFNVEKVQREFVPVNIKNDNQGAIALVKNPAKHMKSKQIDIGYHFIFDYYQSNTIMIEHVQSDENIADVYINDSIVNSHFAFWTLLT